LGRFLKSNWNCTHEVVLPVDGDSCEAADGSVSKITIPSWWMIPYGFKSAATFVLYSMRVCGCAIRAYRERDGVAHVLSYENSPRQANPQAGFGAWYSWILFQIISNSKRYLFAFQTPSSKYSARHRRRIGARHLDSAFLARRSSHWACNWRRVVVCIRI
jgi:hypothetical protein